MLTEGLVIVSEEVNVRVIIFPVRANAVLLLLDIMATLLIVGTVLSKVTLLLLLVAVMAVPALPAASLKAILKGISPSVSPASIV